MKSALSSRSEFEDGEFEDALDFMPEELNSISNDILSLEKASILKPLNKELEIDFHKPSEIHRLSV
jgi:hypothetical protein